MGFNRGFRVPLNSSVRNDTEYQMQQKMRIPDLDVDLNKIQSKNARRSFLAGEPRGKQNGNAQVFPSRNQA